MKKLYVFSIKTIRRSYETKTPIFKYYIYEKYEDSGSEEEIFHTNSKYSLRLFLDLNDLEINRKGIVLNKMNYTKDIWLSIDLRVKGML